MLPFLLAGCVGFSEPVASASGQRMDLTPFLGSWTAEPLSPVDVEVSEAGPGALQATIVERAMPDGASPPVHIEVQLTTIGGQVIASLRASGDGVDVAYAGEWFVGRIDPSEDGTRLTIRTPDDDTISKAIASGALTGRRVESEGGDDFAEYLPIEASGAALRDYFSADPTVFGAAQSIVLTRGTSASNTADDPDVTYSPTTGVASQSQDDPPLQPPTPMSMSDPYRSQVQSAPDAGYPGAYEFENAPTPQPYLGQGSIRGRATPEGPNGYGGSMSPDAGLPQPVKNIVLGLALLLGLGVATAIGLDVLKRRARSEAQRTAIADGRAAGDGSAVGSSDAAADRSGFLSLLRRSLWPGLLVLAVIIGPLLYLVVLIGGLGFPGWSLLAPALQAVPTHYAPVALVFSIGALLAVAEVASSFGAFAPDALRTRWAALLVAFNALGTTTVYAAAATVAVPNYSGYYGAPAPSPLLRALAFALGFAVLIRTRFVLARRLPAAGPDGAGTAAAIAIDGAGDAPLAAAPRDGISIDLGWPYARLQAMCRQRIDRDLLRDGRYATARLLALYPDSEHLLRLAADSITTRDPSEAADLNARLDAARSSELGPGVVRARIARFIVDTGGYENTLFQIEHGVAETSSLRGQG
ncbi:MAG: hypothetical protein ABI780_05620 [Ardenticatenales bacterium]